MFSILSGKPRDILNSVICIVHFSNNYSSEFHKKDSFEKLLDALAV